MNEALAKIIKTWIKIRSLLAKIEPWTVFVYLFLIFRFPNFWYLIVFFLFLHFHFSLDLQNRINKYSNLFIIITVLIVVGTYFVDKRDLHDNIMLALSLENKNNQIAIDSIKSMEDENKKGLPLRKFQVLQTKQYWYKNIDYLTDQCLMDYVIYIGNMESANRFIDMLWSAREYVVETNYSIEEGLKYVRDGLYKINDWIMVDIEKLKPCYKNGTFDNSEN